MELGIKNKVALVLASSKGLGKAVALALAKEGAKVIICGRDQQALAATKKEMVDQTGAEVLSVACDLTDEKQRSELVRQAKDAFGNIDLLVTNTGGPPSGKFEAFDHEDWKDFFELLFVSAADIINRVLPGMKERGFGRILMISSVSIKQPVDNLIASNAVRSSLLGFMKSLANEMGPYGITVNNLMPGFTLTDRLRSLIKQNPSIEEVQKTIPLQRFGQPEEFAAAAAFLLSEKASYISGVSLPVDGGWIKGI